MNLMPPFSSEVISLSVLSSVLTKALTSYTCFCILNEKVLAGLSLVKPILLQTLVDLGFKSSVYLLSSSIGMKTDEPSQKFIYWMSFLLLISQFNSSKFTLICKLGVTKVNSFWMRQRPLVIRLMVQSICLEIVLIRPMSRRMASVLAASLRDLGLDSSYTSSSAVFVGFERVILLYQLILFLEEMSVKLMTLEAIVIRSVTNSLFSLNTVLQIRVFLSISKNRSFAFIIVF